MAEADADAEAEAAGPTAGGGGRTPPGPSRRLAALPVPPSLTASAEESKRRIKLIERVLKTHKTKACLDESEFLDLSKELRELKAELRPAAGKADKAAAAEDEDCGAAQGEGSSRKLQIKREIREVEKQIKQHKKKAFLTAKELSELAVRLDALKEELSGLQDWNPVVLTVAWSSGGGLADEVGIRLPVASDDRVCVAGLAAAEAAALRAGLDAEAWAPEGAAAGWRLLRHEGLRAASLHSRDAAGLAEELAAVAARTPHVICVGTSSLRTRGGACAVLRGFHGALIIIEEDDEADDPDAVDQTCLLHAMGVSARWRRRADGRGLERAELPPQLQGEVIGDLRLRDVKESPLLEARFEEADALCRKEFDEDLPEVLSVDVVRLGLLLSTPPPPPPPRPGAGRAPPPPPPLLLGFITYKFWGPPLKAMSISRVAVPRKYQMMGFGRQLVRWAIEKAKVKPRFECDRVSLSAIPKAYNFYERLNFVPVQDDEVPDDDGLGKDATRMEFSLGRAAKR